MLRLAPLLGASFALLLGLSIAADARQRANRRRKACGPQSPHASEHADAPVRRARRAASPPSQSRSRHVPTADADPRHDGRAAHLALARRTLRFRAICGQARRLPLRADSSRRSPWSEWRRPCRTRSTTIEEYARPSGPGPARPLGGSDRASLTNGRVQNSLKGDHSVLRTIASIGLGAAIALGAARRPRPERSVRSIGPASSSFGAQADRLVSEPDAGETQLQQGSGEGRGRAHADDGSVATDASRRVVPRPIVAKRGSSGDNDRRVSLRCGEFALKAGHRFEPRWSLVIAPRPAACPAHRRRTARRPSAKFPVDGPALP